MSTNPYEMPPGSFAPTGGGGGPDSAAARQKVAAPAIGLIVVGVIGILGAVYGLVWAVLFVTGIYDPTAMQQEQLEQLRAQGQEQAEMAEMIMGWTQALQGPLGLVTNLISLTVGALIVFGAIKMKNLQSYGLALTSSILAMIPCLSCYVVGIPIGIWALVVLMDANVKSSFR